MTYCSSREPDPEPEVEEGEGGGDTDSEEERGDRRGVREEEEEERLRFAEKTVTSLSEGEAENVTPGSFKGFGFKKRSTERPPVRERTSELS